MNRRLVTSASAEHRLGVLIDWLSANADGEVLLVAPTRGAADDLARSAARAGRGLLGLHRATAAGLALQLAVEAMAQRAVAPVSGLSASALAARSIYAAHANQSLNYFAPVFDTPGFPRALSRTLAELRMQQVDADKLRATMPSGSDLAALLSAFAHELDSSSLVDTAAVHHLATEAATGGDHPLLGLPLALADLSPTTRAEQRLLAAIVEAAPRVIATAIDHDDQSIDALARALDAPAESLDGDVVASGKLARLRRYVFLADIPSADDDDDDTSVGLFFEPGEGRECVEIARRILSIARDGIAFDEMSVLLRNPEGYQPLLEDAFRRAKIPAWFSHGTARPDPAGRAFLALLACASEGLTATRFAEYVSLGQVPMPDDVGAPTVREVKWVAPVGEQLSLFDSIEVERESPAPVAVDPGVPPEEDETPDRPVVGGTLRVPFHWEKLLVDASVVGGRDRWQRRLHGLRAELESQRGDDDEQRRDNIDRQLERLGHLERFALPLIEALAALPHSADWGTWRAALEALAALALRRPDPVLALLAELRPMDQVGPVDLDEVRAVLTDRLSFLRNEPPRRRFGRVFVGTLDEARGRAFDTVFLPGLAEGVFPHRCFEDPLLLDDARRELDPDLGTRSRKVDEERLRLRIAAGCARRQLIGSWPSVDTMQGRARVPSFYALDILRAAEGRLPNLRELARRTQSATRLGWPAPVDPQLAIDDAEYDLALIAPLLQRGDKDDQGRARFLLGANAHLARSLRARAGRWRGRWCAADGIIVGEKGRERDDAKTLEVLQRHLPTARSFSPTALQTFANCPYKFLLYAIHRLRTRDTIVELQQLDPLTRGSLFHEVMADLMRVLAAQSLLPMTNDNLVVVLDHADRTLDDVAGRWHEKLAPAIERVWSNEIESLRTDLRGALRSSVDADEPWRPAYFELAFGLPDDPDRDPNSQDEEVVTADGFRLRGSIDLVEADDLTGHLRVTDYKTGKAPYKKYMVIGGGEILQPVLYAWAAEAMLKKKVDAGRLFFCTQRGEYATVSVPNNESSRNSAKDLLDLISTAVGEGFLPASPRQKGCDYCDYRPVCGPYEELRTREVKRENRPTLARLEKLRKRE